MLAKGIPAHRWSPADSNRFHVHAWEEVSRPHKRPVAAGADLDSDLAGSSGDQLISVARTQQIDARVAPPREAISATHR